MSLTLLLCHLPVREAARRVFSEARASAADDTVRKPLSRLLCVTRTVMPTNRQTHVPQIHRTRCPVGVISQKKKKVYLSDVECRKIWIFVSITNWKKRKHF